VDALWELDVPVTSDEEASSVDETDSGPPKRARLAETGARPKAAASSAFKRTTLPDVMVNADTAMQSTDSAPQRGAIDDGAPLNVWGLLDSMDE